MKNHLLISIFVIFSTQISAENFYGKRISIDTGLSQSSVTCITYNNDGALWIGTRFGLNEYSNGKIKTFNNKDCGLEGCYINGLFCDNQNTLWVSNEKGLFLFDNHTGLFKEICNDATNCALEHHDTLFVGGHKGLLYYDKSSNKIKGEESPIWTDILALYSYNDSLLCIDRRNGINIHSNGKIYDLIIPELIGHTLMASYLDHDTLYLSILGEGVLIYDISHKKVKSLIKGPHNELRIVLSINKINDRIWMGTDGNGVWMFDPYDERILRFDHQYSTNPNTEIPNAVTSIFQDPLGNIWLGGERFGLIGLKSSSIRSFLTDKTINYLYYSEIQDKLFVGTNGNGIYSFSNDFTIRKQLKGTEEMKITTIADYDNRNLILCAYNQGFYVYNLDREIITPLIIIDKATNEKECLYGNSPEIYRLQDGRLLFYALHNYIYSTKEHSFTKLNDKEEEYAADLKTIYAKGTDSIYTYSRDGIFKIDIKNKKVDRLLPYNPQIGYINCIAYNERDFVFGTDYGLFKFNTIDNSFSQINSKLFNRVTELIYDNNGILWVCADNTLFKYKDGVFSPIGENKGVVANELHESITNSSGALFLAGSNGFLAIETNTDGEEEEEEDKTIRLHEIELDGHAIDNISHQLNIPHKSKDLSVTISLMNSDPLERTVYKYIVDGTVSYTIETFEEKFRLPIQKSGNYNLMVSYLKGKEEWSQPQTILNFKKVKPWYVSNTAIIIYLILFSLCMTGIILFIKYKMLKTIQADLNKKNHSFIIKFESFVKEHLCENELNVEQIASELAMSRASLYTKVKTSFGKGVGEYIEEQRMEEAKRLLTSTTLSIAEIAEHLGYSTSRYFSTRFKVYTDYSPLSYRKKMVP